MSDQSCNGHVGDKKNVLLGGDRLAYDEEVSGSQIGIAVDKYSGSFAEESDANLWYLCACLMDRLFLIIYICVILVSPVIFIPWF